MIYKLYCSESQLLDSSSCPSMHCVVQACPHSRFLHPCVWQCLLTFCNIQEGDLPHPIKITSQIKATILRNCAVHTYYTKGGRNPWMPCHLHVPAKNIVSLCGVRNHQVFFIYSLPSRSQLKGYLCTRVSSSNKAIQPFVQFSHSVMSNSLQPTWTAAHQASLSITSPWSLPKLMSIKSVMPFNHLILCHPLLLLPSIFPSFRVFSNE